MAEVDKNGNQWTTFLKGVGIRVDMETVRKIATQVVSAGPLHPLYASREKPPVAGKGTVYRIRRLIEEGKLDPLLLYWRLKEVPEVNPFQRAHLKALRKFLQEDHRMRDSFSLKPLGQRMDYVLKQLVSSSNVWLPVSGFAWEALPIVSKIRSHCPRYQLWEHIDEWKMRQNECWRTTRQIAQSLRAEFRESWGLLGSKIDSPTLEHDLLLDIFNWLAGQSLGNLPLNYGGFHAFVIVQDTEIFTDNIPIDSRELYNTCEGKIAWGDTYYARGTLQQVEHAKKAAEDFLKRWSNSKDLRLLIRQFYCLEDLAEKIKADIQQVDETVLAQGRCPDCLALNSEQKSER